MHTNFSFPLYRSGTSWVGIDLIAEFEQAKKESEEKGKAFRAAQKYDLIPRITKKQYTTNLTRIDELATELTFLSQKSSERLLEAEADDALIASRTRNECTQAKRQRTKL